MITVDYDVYYREIINFLHTTSIKFSLFAEAGKTQALTKGLVVDKDADNPYYQNLAGLYSIADDPIYITTVETDERVIFNKENLLEYPKTASIYRIPNAEFFSLLDSNPGREGLIKSIVYPAPSLEEVINARDLSLLAYDSSLLEEGEKDTLVNALKSFLDYVYNRWFIKDFSYEPAYAITFMGMIYSLLPGVLLTQRINNLRTAHVHSMHVWEYLDSKGLGDYKSILNRRQSLWLYRNIDYILLNKGKKTNIEILAENLLRELHLTLVGKTILQDSGIEADNCTTVPEFLSDQMVYRGTTEQIDESEKESMSDILLRMYAEGYYPDYSVANNVEMEDKFGLTEFNMLPTRLLEFKKAIINTRYLCVLTEFLMDSLYYHVSKGTISFPIKFTDANTRVKVHLTVQDTLLLLYYAHHKSFGITPTIPPERYTTRICYPLVKPKNLPVFFVYNEFKWLLESIVNVKQVIQDIPFDNGPFADQEEFLTVLAKQFGAQLKHIRSVRESAHSLYQEAMVYFYNHVVVHETVDLHLTNHKGYQAWIDSNDDIKDLINAYDDLPNPKLFYHNLCDTLWTKLLPIDTMSIFDDFTGMDRDNTAIYAGLKKLFIQLCSYRLFFLETDRTQIQFATVPFVSMYTHHSEETSTSVLPDVGGGYDSSLKETMYADISAEVFVQDDRFKELSYTDFKDMVNPTYGTTFKEVHTRYLDTDPVMTPGGYTEIACDTSLSVGVGLASVESE